MKKLLVVLVVCLLPTLVMAQEISPDEEEDVENGYCPETLVKGDVHDCLTCHVRGNFAVKETKPDAVADYPNMDMSLRDGVAYLLLGDVNSRYVKEFFDYIAWHEEDVKKATIEIFSPGGSLLQAWRIVGMIEREKRLGLSIETHIYGFAASAGFLIFMSGDKRLVSPEAELLWHELLSFKMFDIERPSSNEDEADALRHLQDTANYYIADRCNLTKEEIDKRVKYKDWWMRGQEAYEMGIATGLLR